MADATALSTSAQPNAPDADASDVVNPQEGATASQGEGQRLPVREKEESDEHAEAPNNGGKDDSQDQQNEKDNFQANGSADHDEHESKGPAGGYDSIPIPSPPAGTVGYTLRITIHRATNLIMGDARVFSSDPYVLAQLNTDLPTRHKEDPKLRFRTPTVHRSTAPEWNEEWIVANVPSSGFKLKMRVYDEDQSDHDDVLGKVHITVPSVDDNWKGFSDRPFQIKLRDSSKRAVLIRGTAKLLRIVHDMRGDLMVSIENLGRTGDDGQNGRVYTVGQCRWTRHYSPILGRLAHVKEPSEKNGQHAPSAEGNQGKKTKVERYNFQANQIQLQGPVPAELYHRFVEFKPWVKRMFTTKGIQGVVLGKALHHQHARVYNYGRSTEWGHFPEGPSLEMTKKFLDLVYYDKGGRIFTYVLTLDALWRFTETGKEFGVDLLSKHTMHSDVSIYIAFSGEFFIRRLKHRHRPPPPQPTESSSKLGEPDHTDNETHPPHDVNGGPPEDDPPTDPAYYELVIDNDSGTYRPNADLLPVLHGFLAKSLPGLHIQTLDCQADADNMNKMKDEQRARKKTEGDEIIYTQVSDSSSISSLSSSDNERLDHVHQAYHKGERPRTGEGKDDEREHVLSQVAKDVKLDQGQRLEKFTRNARRKPREGGEPEEEEA